MQQQTNAHFSGGTAQNDAKLNAGTNAAALHGQNTMKRVRNAGDTPPENTQRSKKRDTTQKSNKPATATAPPMPTIAGVVSESNLVIAVFDSPTDGIILPMDKAKYNKLYQSINNTLFSDIDKCDVIPTFNENKHVRGVMKVKCSTASSKSWLIGAIQRTMPLWPNMHAIAIKRD